MTVLRLTDSCFARSRVGRKLLPGGQTRPSRQRRLNPFGDLRGRPVSPPLDRWSVPGSVMVRRTLLAYIGIGVYGENVVDN